MSLVGGSLLMFDVFRKPWLSGLNTLYGPTIVSLQPTELMVGVT